MRKITLVVLAAVLAMATAAQAQMQGGGGGGGGRGHGGGRHGGGKSGPPPVATADDAPAPRPAALNQIVIIGVVRALDLAAERVTISYDAVDQLDWPAGVMPFALGKPGLLSEVKVGEKVWFRLENQRIVEISPAGASPAAVAGGEARRVPAT